MQQVNRLSLIGRACGYLTGYSHIDRLEQRLAVVVREILLNNVWNYRVRPVIDITEGHIDFSAFTTDKYGMVGCGYLIGLLRKNRLDGF